MDKKTRETIKDEAHPRAKAYIARLKKIPGATFIDYDIEAGRWIFSVESF